MSRPATELDQWWQLADFQGHATGIGKQTGKRCFRQFPIVLIVSFAKRRDTPCRFEQFQGACDDVWQWHDYSAAF